jgi:hypothetical protein
MPRLSDVGTLLFCAPIAEPREPARRQPTTSKLDSTEFIRAPVGRRGSALGGSAGTSTLMSQSLAPTNGSQTPTQGHRRRTTQCGQPSGARHLTLGT